MQIALVGHLSDAFEAEVFHDDKILCLSTKINRIHNIITNDVKIYDTFIVWIIYNRYNNYYNIIIL